jgi:hypothetical protein
MNECIICIFEKKCTQSKKLLQEFNICKRFVYDEFYNDDCIDELDGWKEMSYNRYIDDGWEWLEDV